MSRKTVPPRPARRLLLALALLPVLPALVGGVRAWPEIVVPAWLMTRGLRLYDQILFPHTPGTILLTAAAAWLAGLSGALVRGLIAAFVLGTALLVAWRFRGGGRGLSGRLLEGAGGALALVLLACWLAYFEAYALWPSLAMAPLLLGGALLLHGHERTGREASFRRGALVLGVAILVKQTAAWPLLAAVFWCAVASRRGGIGRALRLLAWGSLPYALFAVLWGAAFGTLAHVRWTLLVPVSRHAGEIASYPDPADLLEAVAPWSVLLAGWLAGRALPERARLRSPLAWVAAGVLGMAWPRWMLLQVAGASGILAFLFLRALRRLVVAARRARTHPLRPVKLLALAGAAACLLVHVAVGLVGGGSLLLDYLGGPVAYWEGQERLEARVLARVGRGGRFLNYLAAYDTIYPRTGLAPPGEIYVNPRFWYYLNKEDVDARVVRSLVPGTWVLYREPGPEDPVRETALCRFLAASTREVERIDRYTSWRQVVGGPGAAGAP